MKKIIDISKWNAIVNFSLVNKDTDGVIIRAGFTGNMSGIPSVDSRFFPYTTELSKNKVDIGSYYVTAAITEQEARNEANFFIDNLNRTGVKLTLPIFVCTEWTASTHNGRSDSLNREKRTSIIKAFIDECSKLGFNCGIMAKSSWINQQLIYDELKDYYFWVILDVGVTIDKISMVRTSDKYEVKGIAGYVSVNEMKEFFRPYTAEPVPEIVEEPIPEPIIEEKPVEVKEEPKKKPAKEKASKKKEYKVGGYFTVKDREVFKTSVSSTPIAIANGRCYITDAKVRNGRIRVSDKKNGETAGWIII